VQLADIQAGGCFGKLKVCYCYVQHGCISQQARPHPVCYVCYGSPAAPSGGHLGDGMPAASKYRREATWGPTKLLSLHGSPSGFRGV
jgi:hypothetical protein